MVLTALTGGGTLSFDGPERVLLKMIARFLRTCFVRALVPSWRAGLPALNLERNQKPVPVGSAITRRDLLGSGAVAVSLTLLAELAGVASVTLGLL